MRGIIVNNLCFVQFLTVELTGVVENNVVFFDFGKNAVQSLGGKVFLGNERLDLTNLIKII